MFITALVCAGLVFFIWLILSTWKLTDIRTFDELIAQQQEENYAKLRERLKQCAENNPGD